MTESWTWVLMSFRLHQQTYLSEKGDTNEVALAKHLRIGKVRGGEVLLAGKMTKWSCRWVTWSDQRDEASPSDSGSRPRAAAGDWVRV